MQIGYSVTKKGNETEVILCSICEIAVGDIKMFKI